MTPVTIEDFVINYLEVSSGCTSTFISPPPDTCSDEVLNAQNILQYHPLTWLIVAAFFLIILQMVFAALFPPKAH